MKLPPTAYPRTAFGLVRQCAWCWLVVDRSGRYRLPAPGKILAATHGICPACKSAVKSQIDADFGPLWTAA
jgi:hypothetical protein